MVSQTHEKVVSQIKKSWVLKNRIILYIGVVLKKVTDLTFSSENRAIPEI